MMNGQYRAQLEAAQASGETVTVRYTAGGSKYRYGLTVTGTVEGFVKRPREAEKVRVRRAGEALLTTDVPLRAITAIETPARITTPDRALMVAVSAAGVLSSGPYYAVAGSSDGDEEEFPWPMPMPSIISGAGEP